MSGTQTQDQTVNGSLSVNGPTFGASTVTGDKGLLTGDGSSPEKFPGVLGVNSDPSVIGKAAELGSIALDSATGDWFRKIGVLDTDWVNVTGGGGALKGSPLILTPIATPAALTQGSTTNDWDPSGLTPVVPLAKTSTVRASTTIGAGSATITGIIAGASGQVLIVENFGPQPLVLVHESASSSALNRFNLPGDVNVTLKVEESIILLYNPGTNGSLARWRAAGLAQASTGSGISEWVGDGSDGDHTVSGTESLAGANRYYNNLTVPAGAILRPQGGLICVRGTLTLAGVIEANGQNGGNATVGSAGGGGGGGGGTNTYCGNGPNGATGVTGASNGNSGTASNAGKTWTCLTPGNAAAGGVTTAGGNGAGNGQGGGGGGAGALAAGGAGGVTGTNTPASQGTHHNLNQRWSARPQPGSSTTIGGPWELGGSGGSGGCQGVNGASGGGGGSGGSLVVLCTNLVDAGGSLQAIGGNGGTPVQSTTTGVGGSAGGPGGVITFASFGTNQPTPADCRVTGGTGSNGVGLGLKGGNGSDGVVLKGNPG